MPLQLLEVRAPLVEIRLLALLEKIPSCVGHSLNSFCPYVALVAGWEASYAASNRVGVLTVEDRQAFCRGVCHVLASLPDSQRAKSLHALSMPALDCLGTMTNLANQGSEGNAGNGRLNSILQRVGDEIKIVTTMARSFTDAFSAKNSSMQSGCRTSDGHAAIVEPAFALLQKAWPSIAHVASKYSDNQVCT